MDKTKIVLLMNLSYFCYNQLQFTLIFKDLLCSLNPPIR
jgi:hypothetical protein